MRRIMKILGIITIVALLLGGEAVDMAYSQKPDIILMDLMMPELDGVGACNIIKSDPDTKAIPVIMVTARGHELDQQYAKDMGADGYITKPFASRELLHTIGQFLESPK